MRINKNSSTYKDNGKKTWKYTKNVYTSSIANLLYLKDVLTSSILNIRHSPLLFSPELKGKGKKREMNYFPQIFIHEAVYKFYSKVYKQLCTSLRMQSPLSPFRVQIKISPDSWFFILCNVSYGLILITN